MNTCKTCIHDKICLYQSNTPNITKCPYFQSVNKKFPNAGFINLLCGALVYTKTLEEYNKFKREIKTAVAKEIFEVIEKCAVRHFEYGHIVANVSMEVIAELKTQYTNEGGDNDK